MNAGRGGVQHRAMDIAGMARDSLWEGAMPPTCPGASARTAFAGTARSNATHCGRGPRPRPARCTNPGCFRVRGPLQRNSP